MDIDIELPSSEADDDFEIDLSVSEDKNVDSDEITIDDKESDELEKHDFGMDLKISNSDDELEKTEFDLDIGDLDIGDLDNNDNNDNNEISLTEETDKEDDNEGIELDISPDDDDISKENNQEKDSHASFVEQVAESEDLTTEDVIATKLDLAKAYVEVSDNDNAKTILDEVLAEGDEEQRKQAQILLDQIESN